MPTTTRQGPATGCDGIRAAGPADFEALVDLHARLDPRTVLSRHLTSHPDLSPAHIADLLDAADPDRAALVSRRGGRVTGFGRFVRRPGTAVGDALLLADAEGRAAGDEERLLAQLAEAARHQGLAQLAVEVLPIDREFLDLVDASPLPLARHLHCGTVTVTVDLARLAGPVRATSTSGGGSP